MIRAGNAFIGTSAERAATNFSPGDVFVETDTAQTYIYAAGSWQLMGLDDAHTHDTRYYQKTEVYTKAEVDAIVVAGGTIDWANVLNKPATATRWADWTEVTNKPTTFSPDPASTVYDARYYTETETDTLLVAKQPKITQYYGDSPPAGSSEGDLMYWVNSTGTIRLAVWGTTTSGGILAWRTVTLA